jgi:uncharacterized protein YyaL (SSP411 family)
MQLFRTLLTAAKFLVRSLLSSVLPKTRPTMNIHKVDLERGVAASVPRSAKLLVERRRKMTDQTPMEPSKIETMDDIGTRLEHLTAHAEALEACAEILKARSQYSPSDKERYLKIAIAAEVTRATVDTVTGVNNKQELEFKLYKILKDIPKDPSQIEGGRGTPLS